MDLRFTLFRFPVRIHPFFWLATLLTGSNSPDGQTALIWVVACFFSILIHELGHGFAFRAFGTDSHVVLHQFGGLCVPESSFTRWDYRRQEESPISQIIVAAAGPGAGFLFAAVIVGFVYITAATQGISYPIVPVFGLPRLLEWRFDADYYDWIGPYGYFLLSNLLFINIFWGLVNLLPILPLDGGRISHQLLILADRDEPARLAHQISVAAAIAMAIWGMYQKDMYVTFLFGILAYQNYVSQQTYGWGDRGKW